MKVMSEETFGPVAPVMVYDHFDEVKAGTIWINDPLTDNDAGPFGGMKMSGSGRELGVEGLEEFMETNHIHWDFVQQESPGGIFRISN